MFKVLVKSVANVPVLRLSIQSNRLGFSRLCSSAQSTTNGAVAESSENDKLYKRIEIELRGMDPAVLNSYTTFATETAKHLDIAVGKVWSPAKAEKERFTLLKSAFVHKKHRVQYEVRTYYKFIDFHRLTGSTLSTFLEYIERNLPEGVSLKATKVEMLEMPEHLRQPPEEVKSEQ